jgi:hypothetical protein
MIWLSKVVLALSPILILGGITSTFAFMVHNSYLQNTAIVVGGVAALVAQVFAASRFPHLVDWFTKKSVGVAVLVGSRCGEWTTLPVLCSLQVAPTLVVASAVWVAYENFS